MQRTFTTTLDRIGQAGARQYAPACAARRYAGRGLILIGLAASLLPLAGCEGMNFPWDEEPQPQVSEAIQPGGPSVTRGRPDTPEPAVKPRTKAKVAKKPTAPTTPSVAQQASGPEIAAEPGLPAADDQSAAGAPGSNINADNTSRDSGGAPDPNQPAGNQIASLPGSEPDHTPNQPNEMIGRDENGIRSLIGNPTKTRTEGSTTVWSYEKDGCALDLFLFYDVKTGAQRVLSYEIKPTATDNNAIQACYNKFHNV